MYENKITRVPPTCRVLPEPESCARCAVPSRVEAREEQWRSWIVIRSGVPIEAPIPGDNIEKREKLHDRAFAAMDNSRFRACDVCLRFDSMELIMYKWTYRIYTYMYECEVTVLEEEKSYVFICSRVKIYIDSLWKFMQEMRDFINSLYIYI